MLSEIFIKTPEQKILNLFARNSGKSFYGREISKKLDLSLGAVHGALHSLEQSGILISQNIGKAKVFTFASSNPIIQSFKILSALLMLEPLVEALKDLSRRVILYGSYANGTFAAQSDVDLMIVAETKKKVAEKIDLFQRRSGLDIRPLIKSQVEWMELEKTSPEFIDELSHGIILWERPVDESGF